MDREKEIRWLGSAYEDLLGLPIEAKREAGFQLGRIQAGLLPDDWKPFEIAGSGTREIRIADAAGAFRILYVGKYPEAIYVLHCFRKTTRTTARRDIHIAAVRYKALTRMRLT